MTKEQRSIHKRITTGVQVAVARALERHRKLGEPIAVWKNGRVVVIRPERIPVSARRKRR